MVASLINLASSCVCAPASLIYIHSLNVTFQYNIHYNFILLDVDRFVELFIICEKYF